MCSGGGGQSTIVQPNYSAFNQQFELQKATIEQGMQSGAQLAQQKLIAAQQAQQSAMSQLKEVKLKRAENEKSISAQATRMASLMGPPPPEKSAKAPVVGRERDGSRAKGKAGLRIEKQMALSSSQGAGLNIT